MNDMFNAALRHLLADEPVRVTHLYTLSMMQPQRLDTFKQTWARVPAPRRRKVMQRLVEMTETNLEVNFTPIFLLGLADEEAGVRQAAIEGLWEEEDPALVGLLVHLLQTDPDVAVRAAAATALGQFVLLGELEEIDGAPALLAEQSLLEAIRKPAEDLEVRRRAVEAVAYSGETGIRQVIEAAYFDEHPKMRVSAVFAMGHSADRVWVPTLLRELESDNPEMRFEAARACGELEAAEAIPALLVLIETEGDYEIRSAAIWSLGSIGGSRARQALLDLVEGDDRVLRAVAQEALEAINPFGDELLDLSLYPLEDIEFEDEEADEFD
ncbi:MAG: HEAT repeat domain-containing protein [Anaerolineae bacterium]